MGAENFDILRQLRPLIGAGALAWCARAAIAQTGAPRFRFEPAIVSTLNAVGVPTDAAFADFNFDGLLDAVVAVPSADPGADGALALALADAQRPGAFVLGPVIPVGPAPAGVAIADFNGDMRPDVAVALADPAAGNVRIFVSAGPGELVFDSALSVAGLATALAAADLNGDGLPDLVVASENELDATGLLTIFINQGGGVLGLNGAAPEPPIFASGASTLALGTKPKSVCPADVDSDGDPDLVALTESETTVFANTGAAALRAGAPIFDLQAQIPVGVNALAETIADIDGDGLLDIAVAVFGGFDAAGNPAPGNIAVLLNQSLGPDRIAFGPAQVVLADVQTQSLAAADLDHDGDPDLPIIVGTVPNPTPEAAVLENRSSVGRAFFAPPQPLASPTTPAVVRTANVDNDADQDVATFGVDPQTQPQQAVVAIHRNVSSLPEDIDSDGCVGPGDLLALLAAWGKSCAATVCDEDIDGDGVVGPGDLLRLLSAWGLCTT